MLFSSTVEERGEGREGKEEEREGRRGGGERDIMWDQEGREGKEGKRGGGEGYHVGPGGEGG